MMDKKIRVTITDGRRVSGTLQCVDNSCNLILSDVEARLGDEQAVAQLLSSCMVNGRDIVKCELWETLDEETVDQFTDS